MFNQKIVASLAKSSMIRAMFEAGAKLKAQYGEENVFDFSLGNPEIEPPVPVQESLKKYVNSATPGLHYYMSNAGFEDVREKVAAHLQKKSGVPLTKDHILMVCGAAAGMNIALKALLNPGEEVIVLAPFFVEYLSYIENADGKPVIVKTAKDTFQIDVEAIKNSITPKTKAIILNSPNNPTGVVYSRESLENLRTALEEKEKEFGTSIFVLSDEPYVSIVYDGIEVPNMMSVFKNCVIIYSFSKSHALPGERIGYVAASSRIDDVGTLMGAMITLNRTLGFVNAPALFQKVVAENLDVAVDTAFYQENRDILYNHITSVGFECVKPSGAFYLWMKSPIEDDAAFCQTAQKYNLLIVPGSGFGCPGYARIAYCYGTEMIKRSLKAFTNLAKEYGLI
ncbi:MAG TPA: pyridoxal phosphate-dependent aminotransferase [Thermoclostridium caenicola]|uniref:pyridoxal phosphate-dependent aminotransferase n=1 Tax=Thermoclostridium caenicola TaxID=659425 RepID=UPI002B86A7FB|nr:pyridoxal phosphate-dependent aminotransferase [Thermoclostridium caenicola]HOL85667.1 pyridoxal phosphate-dependent aminotransferase [Thermoclostridium caenicola]HPO77939.1 pyridoxal phosphate-dependent aminotransferase [Thermoclostridium caenicola]